jgi:hypothetical protein
METNPKIQPFMRAVLGRLHESLPSAGFLGEARTLEVDKGTKLYWLRPGEWKADIINVWLDRRSKVRLTLSFEIHLPVSEENSSDIEPSLQTLFNGRSLVDPYYFPNFFGTLLPRRADSFARRVEKAILNQLAWFDEFSTPEKCLHTLRSGESTWGDNRGAAVQALEDFLLRVIQDRPDMK